MCVIRKRGNRKSSKNLIVHALDKKHLKIHIMTFVITLYKNRSYRLWLRLFIWEARSWPAANNPMKNQLQLKIVFDHPMVAKPCPKMKQVCQVFRTKILAAVVFTLFQYSALFTAFSFWICKCQMPKVNDLWIPKTTDKLF